MFIVPMDTPGVEVRPLVLMTGDHGFNEVFCTGARVPAANLVGDVNGGWRCAIAMLMNERVALGASGNSLVSGRADVLIEQARAARRRDDPVLRQRLADIWIREEVLRYVALRVRAAAEAGRAPGPEGSITKLMGSDLVSRAGSLGVAIAGPGAQAWPADDAHAARVVKAFLHAPSLSIAGGTTEIQHNIIGERVLGLPKEPDGSRVTP
jgi:alkylation response protein AidB-like acyl-CoA dehydrogenase